MSKRKDGQPRGKYTLEFKLEAVRLVKGGQAAAVTARRAEVPNVRNYVAVAQTL
jgi:transposase-like protein